LECEKRPPRFAVLAFDLLNCRRTKDATVATSVFADLPHVGVGISVVLTTFVVDLVPESGRSVQQTAK